MFFEHFCDLGIVPFYKLCNIQWNFAMYIHFVVILFNFPFHLVQLYPNNILDTFYDVPFSLEWNRNPGTSNRTTQLSRQDVNHACEWRIVNLLVMHWLSKVRFISHIFAVLLLVIISQSISQLILLIFLMQGQCFKNGMQFVQIYMEFW